MAKKKVFAVMGLLAAVAAIGLGWGAMGASAAEAVKQPPAMMQGMDPKAMADMMNSPQMQQQCAEYMKSPEMQKSMMNVMKQPEMQAAMKRMLQSDAGFHQMMLDLVNSVDMSMDHKPTDTTSMGGAPSGHNSHHQ